MLALAERFGRDLATTLAVLLATTATNGRPTANFPNKLRRGDTSRGFAVDLAHEHPGLALAAANALGVPLPMGATAREALSLAHAHGGADLSALLHHGCERAQVAKPRAT